MGLGPLHGHTPLPVSIAYTMNAYAHITDTLVNVLYQKIVIYFNRTVIVITLNVHYTWKYYL